MEHLNPGAGRGAARSVCLSSLNSLKLPDTENVVRKGEKELQISEALERFYLAAEIAIDRRANPRFTVLGDPHFVPNVLQDLYYEKRLAQAPSENKTYLNFAIVHDGEKGNVYRETLEILRPTLADRPLDALTLAYVRRAIHSRLWRFGGCEIQLSGPAPVTDYIEWRYAADQRTTEGKERPAAKEAGMMRECYGSFEVRTVGSAEELPPEYIIPPAHSPPVAKERSLIGIDIGGSDIKVVVYKEGNPIHLKKVEWYPSKITNPDELEETLTRAIEAAIPHLSGPPDGVGVSCAGVVKNLQIVSSSILEGLPKNCQVSKERGRQLLKTVRSNFEQRWGNGVRWEAANDGAVAALAAAEEIGCEGGVLGIALGTSEAVGFVTCHGNLDIHLNELSFMQIDCGVKLDGVTPSARPESRSGNFGAAAQYLSQNGILALLDGLGFKFPGDFPARPRDRLKHAQDMLKDAKHTQIAAACRGVGIYLGYAVAQYARHYDFKQVVLMGQVMEGLMGDLILDAARDVLALEFESLYAGRGIKIDKPRENEDPRNKERSSYAQARAACRLVH